MTRTEQTSAILRRAAADFLSVAPARAPRVSNPDPAVVAALFHFSFWESLDEGFEVESALANAERAAALIGEGFYSKYPVDWQYLRDIAARIAA